LKSRALLVLLLMITTRNRFVSFVFFKVNLARRTLYNIVLIQFDPGFLCRIRCSSSREW
jgi:hypothetical protein